MPFAPAPGGHEGPTLHSGVSGELDREMKDGSFSGPLLGVPSSAGVDSGSRLGLIGGEKKKDNTRRLASPLKGEFKCHEPGFTANKLKLGHVNVTLINKPKHDF